MRLSSSKCLPSVPCLASGPRSVRIWMMVQEPDPRQPAAGYACVCVGEGDARESTFLPDSPILMVYCPVTLPHSSG